MIRNIFITTTVFFACVCLSARNVSLNFPHFAGNKYYFWAFRGDKKDTISVGQLDQQGKAILTLPQRMKGFRGITQWSLAEGGGLRIIFAGNENFAISCTEAKPTKDNIIYTGSAENIYLQPRYDHQQPILKKIDVMRMATQTYKDDNKLYPIFSKELQKQEKIYNLFQEETAQNPLYAARFAQIADMTVGLPFSLPANTKESLQQIKDYILNELDMQDLYTSGHWSTIIGQFLHDEDNNPVAISDVIKLLKRIQSDEVYTALAEKVIETCEQQNWHDQEIELAFFLLNDSRIKEPSDKIAALYKLLKVTKGSKAPQLTQGELPHKKTILLFYDSSCGNCTQEIAKLTKLYPQLKEQGYEIVSVSADADKGTFEVYAKTLPWQGKFCDFQSFAGKDFLNYGVIGTPTFYILDENRTIMGRYARVEDMKILPISQ